ncbi:MAG: hypothetical protein HRT94_04640 [Alphaproteobacteria bacterium]|nr:hypothetical protein [Alphaproteobacteria bacterium]
MSYNIDQVNEQSSQGQIDEAKRQAMSDIEMNAREIAVASDENRKESAKEEKYNKDQSAYESAATKEATTESTVATEVAMQGAPAAVQLAGMAGKMISDTKQMDPGRFDAKKLAKQTNGMSQNAQTMEDVIDAMAGGSKKHASFQGSENPAGQLVERSNIQSMFTAQSKPRGMAVPPDAITVKQVKLEMNLGQQAHYEATLANAAKAERALSAANRPGLSGPSMSMADGPKRPTHMNDEETAMA